MNKNKVLWFRSLIVASSIAGISLAGILTPLIINADFQEITVMGKFCLADKTSTRVIKTVKVMATAYSSTPEQTDDTPFTTASGKEVRDGVIANNMLPFGTKVRIPELYGNKVFVVEDRMHKRKGKYQVDIWMPEYDQAKEFGAKITTIEILES